MPDVTDDNKDITGDDIFFKESQDFKKNPHIKKAEKNNTVSVQVVTLSLAQVQVCRTFVSTGTAFLALLLLYPPLRPIGSKQHAIQLEAL